MQQLAAWVVAIWMFALLVIASMNACHEGFLKRDEKRNINLLGKELVNCISFDEGNLFIDREKCFRNIKALPTSSYVKAIIFVHDDIVYGMTEDSTVTLTVESDEKSACVNRVLNMLVERDNKAAKIEIAYNGMEDSFFNELGDDICVFLVSEHENFLSVSGFSLIK